MLVHADVDSGVLDDIVVALHAGIVKSGAACAVAGADEGAASLEVGADGGIAPLESDSAKFGLALLSALSVLPRFSLAVEFMGADSRGRARRLIDVLEPGASEEAVRLRTLFKV